MLAFAKGDLFDETLARDFSPEDLWDHNRKVPSLWLKLLFAYLACTVTQIILPLVVVALVILPFQGPNAWAYWALGIAIASPMALVGAILAATGAYLKVSGLRRKQRSSAK